MADPVVIARAFCEHYYNLFDRMFCSDDANEKTLLLQQLMSLYQANSMLTFEGQQFAGQQNVAQKIASLTLGKCRHQATSIDGQPTFNGGVLVFVNGLIALQGESHQTHFSQVFHLLPVQSGNSYWVYNDMFRLNYG